MSFDRVFRYLVNSLLAPRRAAAELMDEQDTRRAAWTLINLSAGFTFLSSFVVNALVLTFAPRFLQGKEPLFMTGYVGYAYDAAIVAVIFVFLVFVTGLVWKHMFGYRVPAYGVLAAVALTVALNAFTTPFIEVLFLGTDSFGTVWEMAFVFIALVLFMVPPAFYFSETLNINTLRAFSLNTAATLMVWVPFFILPVVAIVYYLTTETILPDGAQ